MPIVLTTLVHGPLSSKLALNPVKNHNKAVKQTMELESDIEKYQALRKLLILPTAEVEPQPNPLLKKFYNHFKDVGADIKSTGQGIRYLFRKNVALTHEVPHIANNEPCTGIITHNDWNLSHTGRNVIIPQALEELNQYYNQFLDTAAHFEIEPAVLFKYDTFEALTKKYLPDLVNQGQEIMLKAAERLQHFASEFLTVIPNEPVMTNILAVLNAGGDPKKNLLKVVHYLLKDDDGLDLFSSLPITTFKDNFGTLVPTKYKFKISKKKLIPELELDSQSLPSSPTSKNSPSDISELMENSPESVNNNNDSEVDEIPTILINMYTVGTGDMAHTSIPKLEEQINILKAQYEITHVEPANLKLFEMIVNQYKDYVMNDDDLNNGPKFWGRSLSRATSSNSLSRGNSASSPSSRSTTPLFNGPALTPKSNLRKTSSAEEGTYTPTFSPINTTTIRVANNIPLTLTKGMRSNSSNNSSASDSGNHLLNSRSSSYNPASRSCSFNEANDIEQANNSPDAFTLTPQVPSYAHSSSPSLDLGSISETSPFKKVKDFNSQTNEKLKELVLSSPQFSLMEKLQLSEYLDSVDEKQSENPKQMTNVISQSMEKSQLKKLGIVIPAQNEKLQWDIPAQLTSPPDLERALPHSADIVKAKKNLFSSTEIIHSKMNELSAWSKIEKKESVVLEYACTIVDHSDEPHTPQPTMGGIAPHSSPEQPNQSPVGSGFLTSLANTRSDSNLYNPVSSTESSVMGDTNEAETKEDIELKSFGP